MTYRLRVKEIEDIHQFVVVIKVLSILIKQLHLYIVQQPSLMSN